MTARHPNLHPYVLYKLGGLTVTVTDRACDACGRANHGLEYRTKRRSGTEVVICHVCMGHISDDHAEYMQQRKRKPS